MWEHFTKTMRTVFYQDWVKRAKQKRTAGKKNLSAILYQAIRVPVYHREAIRF